MPNRLAAALVAVLISAQLAVAVASETGIASWYGPGFCGKRTASGERFNCAALTCARPSFQAGRKPYWIQVTNLANGRSASCKVNDRGPFAGGRRLDVSPAMKRALGMGGLGRVRID